MGEDQNFILFQNMGSEIICLFLLENSEGIFDRPKKLVWGKQVVEVLDKCLIIFGPLENILDESKTMGEDQNFMLFQNMNSEMLCLFFLRVLMKSLTGLKIWFGRRTSRFLPTPLSPFTEVLKTVRLGNFCRANTSLQIVILNLVVAFNQVKLKAFFHDLISTQYVLSSKKSICQKEER
jgi:hypothetical protein